MKMISIANIIILLLFVILSSSLTAKKHILSTTGIKDTLQKCKYEKVLAATGHNGNDTAAIVTDCSAYEFASCLVYAEITLYSEDGVEINILKGDYINKVRMKNSE